MICKYVCIARIFFKLLFLILIFAFDVHTDELVPQFCSSDMSPQSLSPSQIQGAGIQLPVL